MKSELFAASLVAVFAGSAAAKAEMIDFEYAGNPGEAPQGFSVATTGPGKAAVWKLEAVTGAPSGKLAVAQTSADPTGNRFPLLVYDKVKVSDADISIKFKAVSGKEDQAAGIVWRYTDKSNYYLVRANALEGNVVLYIVKDGRRTDLPLKGKGKTYGANVPVAKDVWHALAVSVNGSLFKVSFNGRELYEVEDNVFAGPGKIGLWTKADCVMLFDDLAIENPK